MDPEEGTSSPKAKLEELALNEKQECKAREVKVIL